MASTAISKDLGLLKGKVARKAAGMANSPMVEDIVLPGCIARTSSHKDVIAAKDHSAAAERGGARRVASDGSGLLPQQQQLPVSTNASNGLSLPDVSGGRRSNNMAAGSSGSGKMVGLSNLGNTCFMNSSLQCLLYTTPLIQYFQQGQHKQDLNPSAPCKGLVASAYAKFVDDVASSSGTLSPKEFKRVLTKHAPHLLDYQQQDCQEFLRFLLDNMSEDLCRKSSVAAGAVNVVITSSSPTSASPDKKMAALGAEMGALGIGTGTSGEEHQPTSTSPNSSSSRKKKKFSQRLRNQVSASALLSEEDDGGGGGGVPAGDDGELLAGSADAAAANSRVVYDGGGATAGTLAAPPPTKRPTNNSFRARAASSAASLLGMSSTVPEVPAMSASEEASKAWANYLRHNDSVVTDIFAGQMQSTVECLTCGHKSKSYDPFLDLSVPVPRPASEGAGYGGDGGGGDCGGAEGGSKPKMGGTLPARRRGNAARHKTELSKCKLSDCLDKFSATEMLDDDNLPTCDRCKKKRRCTKTLSVYRHPQVLVIHIKRFSYTTVSRDKMETDVSFPSEGLDMSGYLSLDVKNAGEGGGRPTHVHGIAPVYDLVAVCHHMGGLTGGHYTSFVDTSFGSGERKWTHFNDARVSPADVGQVGGPSAYVLFYRIRT